MKKDYTKMRRQEMIEVLKSHGVKTKKTDKRDDLIAKLVKLEKETKTADFFMWFLVCGILVISLLGLLYIV